MAQTLTRCQRPQKAERCDSRCQQERRTGANRAWRVQHFGQDRHLWMDSRIVDVKQVVYLVWRDEGQDLGFELGRVS